MEWYVIPLFIIGLACLIKGGDWFVDGASGIAKRFKIPQILIGATVVSIGTTLPEVMVSATSALQGVGSIAYGNAIGSIICNTALICAITVAIKPMRAERNSLLAPSIFFFASAIFYICIAIFLRDFARWVGIVLLAIFVIYMVATVLLMKRNDDTVEERAEIAQHGKTMPPKTKGFALVKEIVFIVIGATLIALGARLLVDNATIMAKFFGMSEALIGLTIVALGTSLPELVTAITALVKGHSNMSLGNIIGANLFNLILVSGVSITIAPFTLPSEEMLLGVPVSMILDIPIALLAMVILVVPTLIRQKLSRVQGISLLVIYVGYMVARFLI